ncbi:MAG: drug resistance transporter, EmrB/QacA subfamily [Pseudonocardiales bacterium]|nr:drug resistance transporter, EmrB/QacA subfamily [Pseudonocardiales bacterium]
MSSPSRPDPDRSAPRAGYALGSARGRGIVLATVLGSSLAFLDGTIATVATDRIGQDFDAGFGSLQWVLNGYTLPLASLILLGGSLGDRLGRRRIYLLGIVWFVAASVLCALAPSIEVLIAARALQGVGAALLTPGSLAILSASIAPDDRAKAVGAWSGLTGVAGAIGPFVGGWLVENASWRWAFAINIPLGAAVVLFTLRFVPESSAEKHAHIDGPGVLLTALGLGGLTLGLTLGGERWSVPAIGLTAVGAAALVAFVLSQRGRRDPLVPLSLFADRTFTGTNLMTFATYGALAVIFFTFPLALQVAAGYGPLAAGIASLPITVLLLILSARAGALATRIGPRLQLTAGPLVASAGALLLLRVHRGHNNYLLDVAPGVVVFGIGLAALVAPLTAAVMGAAPADLVGTASGINNAVSRAAGLLTIAVLPSFAGLAGEAYRDPATMIAGFRTILLICAGLLAAGGLISLVTVPHKMPVGDPGP